MTKIKLRDENAPPTAKEAAYDAHINPLVTQIIQLCTENNINFVMTYELSGEEDSGLMCTTAVLDSDNAPVPDCMQVAVGVITGVVPPAVVEMVASMERLRQHVAEGEGDVPRT